MLDERTRRAIEHARRIRAVLVQPELEPVPLARHGALLLALNEGLLDPLPLGLVERFKRQLGEALDRGCPQAVTRIERSGELSRSDRADLLAVMTALIAELGPDGPGGAD